MSLRISEISPKRLKALVKHVSIVMNVMDAGEMRIKLPAIICRLTRRVGASRKITNENPAYLY